jgi:GMP synthase (glutamine-hydrolysing)
VELLVLEHDATTGACRFTDVLDARTDLVPWRRIDVAAGEALPHDLDAVAGILVMGGPQSVTADHADGHAWLPGERELLRAAVDSEVPVLAVCLGAQVLADAAGGEVTRLDVPEIGYLPLTRAAGTADEEVTAGWPDGAASLLLHEDGITTLPPDAVPLLEGPSGPVAWRLGSAVATQAHPEVDVAQLRRWAELDSLAALLGRSEVDLDELLEEAERRDRFVVPLGQALIGRFVDGPVRRRVTGSKR